jgi:hypothetical protein
MQKKLLITTKEEYLLCLKHGVNPLFWNRWIKIEIGLRIYLQNELFGKSQFGKVNIPVANDRYYRYCFFNSLMICENCGKPLYANKNIEGCYSAVYVSHILTKGGHPEIAHDPRNQNILCFRCHQKWESVKNNEMVIFMDNQVVIVELRNDYNKLFCNS